MKKSGFVDVQAHPYSYSCGTLLLGVTKKIYEGILQTGIANGIFTQEEIEGWWKTLSEYAETDNLLVSYTGFIVCGTKG